MTQKDHFNALAAAVVAAYQQELDATNYTHKDKNKL